MGFEVLGLELGFTWFLKAMFKILCVMGCKDYGL
jgi:hypothetical protein